MAKATMPTRNENIAKNKDPYPNSPKAAVFIRYCPKYAPYSPLMAPVLLVLPEDSCYVTKGPREYVPAWEWET